MVCGAVRVQAGNVWCMNSAGNPAWLKSGWVNTLTPEKGANQNLAPAENLTHIHLYIYTSNLQYVYVQHIHVDLFEQTCGPRHPSSAGSSSCPGSPRVPGATPGAGSPGSTCPPLQTWQTPTACSSSHARGATRAGGTRRSWKAYNNT